jgi:predicted regulator of Ras-like GTPase activity (Roadblock/LC7/MglB family)
MPDSIVFDDVVSVIRSRVDGVLAVATLAADGSVDSLVRVDPEFDQATVAEFATLVRIAERISIDASTGLLDAMTWKTEKAVVLMNRIPPDRSLMLFGSRRLQASLARYLLARAAPRLATPAESGQPLRHASF